MSTKLALLFGLTMLALFLLAFRIIKIYSENYDDYAVKVLSNYSYSSTEVSAPRGTITDRNGNILAYSDVSYLLILEPKTILDSENHYSEATIQALCKIIGLDREELVQVLQDNSTSLYYRYKAEDGTAMIISSDTKAAYEDMVSAVNVTKTASKRAALEELFDMDTDTLKETYADYADFQMQGVWFERRYDRVYPYDELACKVVGYYSANYVDASTGIEKSYDLELTGVDGKSYGYLNGDYNVTTETVEPVQGNTIVSTIDIEIQAIVEEALQAYNEEYGAQNLAAIVMNPNNGEILAMANGTTYNLNDPTAIPSGYTESEWEALTEDEQSEKLNAIYKNYCVSSSYEPGSIFKPLTIAAAIEEGALTGSETFYCGGYMQVNGWIIRCHNREGCGELDIFGALQNSCNVSLMNIVNLLGKEDFTTYFNRFGFGKKTGIDLPSEVDCATLVYSDFTTQPDVTLACASFGQGFNVTMVQMAAAMASVVNGGYYYTPHVVKEVRTVDGVSVETADTNPQFRTISTATSDYMKEALYTVVEDGTGAYAKIEGYNIGGKTGTAEMVENRKRLEDLWVASFISAAPIEDPDLLVYVVVDRTNDKEYYNSSKPAQDISKAIWSKLLPYYNIHSNLDEYDYLIPEETSAPIDDSFEGSYIESEGAEDEVGSDEEIPSESVEAPGETQAPEESAGVPADNVEVPVETQAPETAAEVPVEGGEIPAETQASETAAEVPVDGGEIPAETQASETAAEVPVDGGEVPAEY
jgi:stage V sporulation protein D (sporulation-specific penicillin-binding protein)